MPVTSFGVTGTALARRPLSGSFGAGVRFNAAAGRSSVPSMLIMQLRCSGYTPREAANELYGHTPARPKGQNHDERIDYGRRVVWYAFGTAGEFPQAVFDSIFLCL